MGGAKEDDRRLAWPGQGQVGSSKHPHDQQLDVYGPVREGGAFFVFFKTVWIHSKFVDFEVYLPYVEYVAGPTAPTCLNCTLDSLVAHNPLAEQKLMPPSLVSGHSLHTCFTGDSFVRS